MNSLIKSAFYIVFITVLCVFIIVVYGHVFSDGLYSTDDSAIAIAAKNLSLGLGYSTTIPYDGSCSIQYFDPSITTGPTMVLPAAFMILLFGNLPWVPGFVTATVNLILLIMIFIVAKRMMGLFNSALLLLIMILFFYSFTARLQFIYWYSLIGEAPASLFSILGAFVIVTNLNKRSTVIIACLIFGLAFMTKMLSLIGFIPIFIWFVYQVIREKENRKKLFYLYSLGLLAFITPFVFFEIWKLMVIGINSYYQNILQFIGAFHTMHGSPKVNIDWSLIQALSERSKIIYENFGYSLIVLLIIAFITGGLIFALEKQHNLRYLFTFLMLGALFHFFWWVFFSKGWPRYEVIGLFLYFSAISCVILIKRFRPYIFYIYLLFFVVFAFVNTRIFSPISFVIENKYEYTPRVKNLLRTVDYLNSLSSSKPFISSWWATYADIEYALPTVGNFKLYNRLNENDYNRELILVRNTNLVNFYPIPEFEEFEKKFTEILFYAPPYLVSRSRDIIKKNEP